jgi:hypothetical protein
MYRWPRIAAGARRQSQLRRHWSSRRHDMGHSRVGREEVIGVRVRFGLFRSGQHQSQPLLIRSKTSTSIILDAYNGSDPGIACYSYGSSTPL